MADETLASSGFRVVATTGNRLKELPISNGQMIFVEDLGVIAFDNNSKRRLYTQIIEIATEEERKAMTEVDYGYYFVIDSACFYFNDGSEWTQIGGTPSEVVFIGVEKPELGKLNVLYADTTAFQISVWDEESKSYVVVADKTQEVSNEYIEQLFA